VEKMLEYYQCREAYPTVCEWYDGYCFGDKEVFNPWSLINFVQALSSNKQALPAPYWSNTSSNSIVKKLIKQSNLTTRDEIEQLIGGGSVEKPVHEDITYEDIHSSQDNLWNFLFFTGYLKQVGRSLEGDTQYVRLAIPNREVAYIYKNAVRSWFDARMTGSDLSPIYQAFETGDTDTLTDNLSRQLQDTISFFDYAESYYHGFLTGILKNMGDYMISSNRESGTGRPDIILKTPSVRGRAIILELKVAKTFYKLNEGCDAALRQIQQKKYADGLRRDGYQEILSYGICFYQKECLVKKL
jgi:hypothetical protein